MRSIQPLELAHTLGCLEVTSTAPGGCVGKKKSRTRALLASLRTHLKKGFALIYLGLLGALAAGVWAWTTDWYDRSFGDSHQLIVRAEWPTLTECDGATETAMPPGGMALRSIPWKEGQDTRHAVVSSGGAAFERGWLTVTLTAHKDQTILVTGIQPKIFKRTAASPTWKIQTEGGCGDSSMRLLDWDLDATGNRPALIDKGIHEGGQITVEDLRKLTSLPDGIRGSFTVSESDTTEFIVGVHSCRPEVVEWGLVVKYTHDGDDYTENIGSPEQPFRSIAGKPAATYREVGGGSGNRHFEKAAPDTSEWATKCT